MNKKLTYFPEEDIIHFNISNEEESSHIEITPNIIAELNEKGELIGIEILEASSFIRDFLLDSIQAKLLELKTSEGV